MEKNTEKEFTLIVMEMFILDGGLLEKNKERVLMCISHQDKE